MLLLLTAALAKEVLAPPPIRVETAADGLAFSRPGDEAEGGDSTPPDSDSESAYKAWWRVVEARKDRRADLAEADTLLGNYAPVVADCAMKAGSSLGAVASARLTLSVAGIVQVGTPQGDAGLGDCLRSVLHRRQVGAVLHPGKNLEPTYTFTLVAAPTAVAEGVDIEASFGGVGFGAASTALIEAHLSSSFRNTAHYTRSIDDNVRFMGVPCATAYSFDADEGLYGAEVRVDGDSDSFRLREAMKSRFGAGKWDGEVKGWYWRGARFVYVTQRVPDTAYEVLRIVDMDRARRAQLAVGFPGDPDTVGPASMKGLPRVLRAAEAN